MFTDRVNIQFIAGKGGNGVVAWHRARYVPKGGPCGGNGGRGGSIILKADPQIASLDAFRHHRIIKAKDGGAGGPNLRQGKNGPDLTLKVPCGTLIKSSSTGELICDLTEPGQTFILCKGGKGGKGNDTFKSPTNRAPTQCTLGEEGQVHQVELELKLIADVGLVGFPNAGKSTLISALTRIRPKIAAYPFTTLHPNLGYIETEQRRIYIADIPGIIEGAHQNRGLGYAFLRHIERTSLLLFLLDSSGIDGRTPTEDYRVLRKELESYDPTLLERPHLVVLNKIDTDESAALIEQFKQTYSIDSTLLFEISAICGTGLMELRQAIIKATCQEL